MQFKEKELNKYKELNKSNKIKYNFKFIVNNYIIHISKSV